MQAIVEALKPFFDAIQVQFAAIDQRFAAIDQRFAAIDQRFATINEQLEDVKATGRKTAVALAKLDDTVLDIRLTMATERQLAAVNARFESFTSDIKNARSERLLSERSIQGHDARLDDHESRLKRLEDERSS